MGLQRKATQLTAKRAKMPKAYFFSPAYFPQWSVVVRNHVFVDVRCIERLVLLRTKPVFTAHKMCLFRSIEE